MDTDNQKLLEQRLGKTHARQRLGIEADSGHHVFGGGINFFHPENWYNTHSLIKLIIRLSGLYNRGKRNACNIQVKKNRIEVTDLPSNFHGFTMLQLSDLHIDMYEQATKAMLDAVAPLEYDVCVMTGDYRAKTYGDTEQSMAGMKRVAEIISKPIYGVLGNHDSITMVPALESFGIQMLLNESAVIERGEQAIQIAGVDDAHYFRVENIARSTEKIADGSIAIMLSHTPEIYRQVAHAGFNIMLCGHTHGGQICLPGGVPLTLDARCPRYVGKGAWIYGQMSGYTSVGSGTSIVNVRYNCLPEVTLHQLVPA
jgi:predicted MPP superfamily phosphohydrolase